MSDDDDERPTLLTCLACGGRDQIVENRPDGTYRVHRCEWCTAGAMTATQMVVYRNHRRFGAD